MDLIAKLKSLGWSRPDRGWRMVVRFAYALFYLGGGVNHFANPETYMPMMPPFVPAHLEMIYLSGVAEILLGIGLLYVHTVRGAAWGIIALLIAVFPAHVHMLQHQELFPEIPTAVLWIRLPVQALFIWWAWIYTRPARADVAGVVGKA